MAQIIDFIKEFGLLAVFINVFAQAAGLPLPCYPIVILAAALVGHTNFTWFEILLTGQIAMMSADQGWLWAGRRYGTRMINLLCKISITPDSCARSTGLMFEKIGPATLVFSRFIPGFSGISVVLAGAARLPLWIFLLFEGLGVALYIGLAILLGTLFRDNIAQLLTILTQIGQWSAVLIIGALSGFLTAKWMQRQRLIRRLRMARATVDEVAHLIETGAKVALLDVRPPEFRAKHGMIPGSLHAETIHFETALRQLARDTEIITYCSCPNEVSAANASLRLKKLGYKNTRPLLGGIEAWSDSGKPLEFLHHAA